MPKSHSKLFAISSLCLLLAFGLLITRVILRSRPYDPIQSVIAADDPLKEIANYRSWTRVNSEPQLMPDRTATLCAPLTAVRIDESRNPHHNKYLTVYVNELGRKGMLEQRRPDFPEGSVIIKEKLSDKTSQTPELMTAMIKRGKGFNPDSGDWEYLVVDGAATKATAQGKLESCQACHSTQKLSGYIFRTYLPNDVLGRLK